MKLAHPTDSGRSKNVPDDLVEKFLANGWTKVEKPAKKAAPKPPKK